MSHTDYILKRRKEVDSAKNCDRVELTVDVLGKSNSALSLVDYASDESDSSECEETRTLPNSGLFSNLQV